jgi:hypothetical protein
MVPDMLDLYSVPELVISSVEGWNFMIYNELQNNIKYFAKSCTLFQYHNSPVLMISTHTLRGAISTAREPDHIYIYTEICIQHNPLGIEVVVVLCTLKGS